MLDLERKVDLVGRMCHGPKIDFSFLAEKKVMPLAEIGKRHFYFLRSLRLKEAWMPPRETPIFAAIAVTLAPFLDQSFTATSSMTRGRPSFGWYPHLGHFMTVPCDGFAHRNPGLSA